MQQRREIEAEMDAIADSAMRREGDLTRRYQNEVEMRQLAAEEEAAQREELLMRQTEAARRAMNEAMSLAGSFASAFTAFSNNLTQAVGNMVQGIGNSMENMAAVITSGVTAFLSGIGQMIGSAAVGEEGIGASFGNMVLQLIAQLSAMILGIMITAKVMGAQWWNPALAIAGGIGLVAASAGLAALANLRNQQGSSAPAPGSVNAMQAELRELREQRDAATSQAERDRLNEEIERLEGEIAEARGQDEVAPSQMEDSGEPTATDSDMGASVGGTSQGVQLAVAVPLMDAATIMQSAAQSIQATFQTGDGMSFGSAAMSFDDSVGRFGGYVDRLVEEGIAVNLTERGSRTAAFRG
jgi:hypothetical protein